MAALSPPPPPIPSRANTTLTIELSDDEEDGPLDTIKDADGVHDNDDVDDSGSDSSLLSDILHAGEDDEYQIDDSDVCTQEEAVAYRKRLREVGLSDFVEETVSADKISAKKLCTAFGVRLPEMWKGKPDSAYYQLLGKAILRFMQTRQKLPQYNTMEDAVELLRKSKNIMVITGAGISTNVGIPDFRSKHTGFYEKMRAAGFESGEEVFDIEKFEDDPSVFYRFCNETLPKGGVTTPTHAFIRLLQDENRLLTNYTQNIDNIEDAVGLSREKLIQCHGSWATATCRQCQWQTNIERIEGPIRAGKVPACPKCAEAIVSFSRRPPGVLKRKRRSDSRSGKPKSRRHSYDDDSDDDGSYDIPQPGVMKPDITFFGEALPKAFFDRFRYHDIGVVDLVIVIGTSMQVAPVSEIPRALNPEIPQIYISRDPCHHIDFDITFLGDCDVVVAELAKRVGWKLKHTMLPAERKVEISAHEDWKGVWQVKPLSAATTV